MTVDISPATEQLLHERMQTGRFATLDDALHQALELSPSKEALDRNTASCPGTLASEGETPSHTLGSGKAILAAFDELRAILNGEELDFERNRSVNSNRDTDFS